MSFIYSIFEQLASDNSRLAKEAILIKNKSNGTLQRVFYLALDPFQQFYIRKIPEYTISNTSITLDEALDQLDALNKRLVTRHAVNKQLTTSLASLTSKEA
jgi:hypothetical protein